MRRRDFIKQASSALLVLSSGKIISVTDGYEELMARKPLIRFCRSFRWSLWTERY